MKTPSVVIRNTNQMKDNNKEGSRIYQPSIYSCEKIIHEFFHITNLSVTDIQQNGLITFVNVIHACMENQLCATENMRQGGGNLMMVSGCLAHITQSVCEVTTAH
jgi:hypothetical protein